MAAAPGRSRRADAEGPDPGRRRRGPRRLRPGRVVRGRRGAPAPQESGLGLCRARPAGRRTAYLPRWPRGRRRTPGPAAGERSTVTYAVPPGGLPPQSRLTTDRARFTEAYAVIPRGSMTDIVASYLPHWEQDPLLDPGPAAQRLRGDVQPLPDGGRAHRRLRPPRAGPRRRGRGVRDLGPTTPHPRRRRTMTCGRAATPTCRRARSGRSATDKPGARRSTGSARRTSGWTASTPRRRS